MANGEVMNRVRSFLLEPTFANREGMAPEDVARRRAMAEALWSQGNSSQPVVGVFDGMNRVLQSFLGGRQMRKAEDADQFIRQREDQQQQAGLQQMAAFAYPNQTTTEPPTTRPLATPTYGAGTQNEWSAGDWPGGAQTTAPGTGIDAGVRLLDQYEGFSGTPYDDWSYRPGSGERYNSGQRIGYGQTIPGQTSITQEQAQQLLRQQIETEYVPSIVNTIGPERWASFTPDQQGVLISLVHNYGSLPNRILDEIATGDPQAIAGAITALGEDNQGINRNRRTGEAAYFAGTPGERTTTTANPVGEFVQGLISNPQTRGVAAQLIGDQITRLTTPPAPQEPYTLGANETRFDANNRPVATGAGGAGDFQERPLNDQERAAYQIPATDTRVWVMTANGPEARGGAGQTINVGTGTTVPAGFEAVDRAYAPDYVAWTAAGGYADVQRQMNELNAVISDINGGANITGPIIGMTPNLLLNIFNPEAVDARNRVEEVVQRNLRAVLGAQFTQVEGERLIARAFNPALPDEVNAQRLQSLLVAMDAAAKAKEDAAAYFRQNGTLWGWQGTLPSIGGIEAAMDTPAGVSSPGAAPAATGAPAVPAPGTIMDGYRFNGGDPADQRNWTPVQ